MTRKKSDDAVSPVIGVMLMLVVTVVIAAVVAVFATGMVEGTEPAPIAKLDVKIIHDQPVYGMENLQSSNGNHGTAPTLHLTHVSGDPLDTADLKLSFSWECDNPDCDIKDHTSTYQAGILSEETSSKLSELVFEPYGYGYEPLYINYGMSGGASFGNHILKRGETMVAYDIHLTVAEEGLEMAGNPAMDVLFNNGEVITEYSETVTETKQELIIVPGTEGANYFTKNKEVHPENTNCVIGKATYKNGPNNYWTYSASGLMCPAVVMNMECDGEYIKCPFCGVTPTKDTLTNKFTCPSCGKYVKNVKGPTEYMGDVSTTTIGTGYSAGIMECLPEGTAVKVMITHIPSNKVIYEDRVFVE